ncbi:MAG: ABC transporter ATP-binding protein [Rubripirellula sp.]|nr:ABC transporter ATP-binding protein [Rubripirellula sp.]
MSADIEQRASSIHCRSLSVAFAGGVKAVDAVDLTVGAGEIISLIGPSGCGKTTLLRCMAGLQAASDGEVTLDPPVPANHGNISLVFQQPTLLPWRTALENVLLPLQLTQCPKQERRTRAESLLETVGLAHAMDRFPRQLSGGMKMRVSIARALVTRPQVLLLDEPFAALDDMLRSQLGELLLELWQAERFTAVMVTHNIAESILLTHQVAVMQHGKLVNVLDNPLPWPRDPELRTTPEFGKFYGCVTQRLKGDD